MRIKLRKNYQKKLILLAKNKKNLSWKELSEKLNLAEGYLKNELKKEKRTISKEVYNKLTRIANINFNSYIEKRLDDNWGRSKGGLTYEKPKLLIKKQSKELAELLGVLLGDGNIWKRKGYYYITICGDSEKDKEYLLNYIKPLFEKLFNKKMHIKYHKKSKELFIVVGSRDVVFTLENFGLKSGNKKENDVGIPNWIFNSKDYLKACIRGLIDTDGSLCPITGRNYNYIWFSSNITQLRKDFDKAMKKIGLKNSKWNIRKGRTPETFIGNKRDINEYIRIISFKNKRHLNKLSPHSSEAKFYSGVKSR